DQHGEIFFLKGFPCPQTVLDRDDFMPAFLQRGFQHHSGNIFIFGDEDFHWISLSCSISIFTLSNSRSSRKKGGGAPATLLATPRLSNCLLISAIPRAPMVR